MQNNCDLLGDGERDISGGLENPTIWFRDLQSRIVGIMVAERNRIYLGSEEGWWNWILLKAKEYGFGARMHRRAVRSHKSKSNKGLYNL